MVISLLDSPDPQLTRYGGNFGFHRWRNSQGFVNSAQIVVHEIESDGMHVIFEQAFVSRVFACSSFASIGSVAQYNLC
jgi:hypothetical protein